MSYTNEIPTRDEVHTWSAHGMCSYSYEEIAAAIQEANAINAEYDATYQAVGAVVESKMETTDFMLMSDEERQLLYAFNGVNGNAYLDAVNCKGATKRGATEFWPVGRIRKDTATMRRQIKNLRKFQQERL